ncbi:MAG: hypothetical protein H6696_17115 [Deferribacteres bacterium]|nr:hypothetical protein [Deferribacteres bacterium]
MGQRSCQPRSASMQHTGVWPWGPHQPLFFDLNRDWFILSATESRSRMQLVVDWNPTKKRWLMPAKMGDPNNTFYLIRREPINPNVDTRIHHWWEVFLQRIRLQHLINTAALLLLN